MGNNENTVIIPACGRVLGMEPHPVQAFTWHPFGFNGGPLLVLQSERARLYQKGGVFRDGIHYLYWDSCEYTNLPGKKRGGRAQLRSVNELVILH